jgi:hypothetical protein
MKLAPARLTIPARIAGGLFSIGAFALASGAMAADKDPVLYKDIVSHIVEAKCVGCHGEEKQKGKLRLDSLEHILQGSDGENVVPGDPAASLFVERILLPADDDDHMPPEDKDQLTANEIKVLEFWVKSGAKGDLTLTAAKADAPTQALIAEVLANLPKAQKKDDAPAVDPKILAARKKVADEVIGRVDKVGATLMPIAQDTPELRFSALNVAKEFNDEHLKILAPAADQIQWVDLARTQVSDAGVAALGNMKNVTRLHLENTKIGDAALAHLAGLTNLEYINLYGTQVTDKGLATLAKLPNLKKVFVWQSKVTDKGVAELAAKLPNAEINNGWKADTKAVEVAAATPAKPAPAKPAPAKPTPPKPEPKKPTPPTPKPAPKPAPTPAKPAPAKPAPNPELQKAIAEAEKAVAAAKKAAADASVNAKKAQDSATATQKVLDELRKAAASTPPAAKK